MNYLNNAWYVACQSEELTDSPLARTILDQPIMLYRCAGGAPAGLYDACPHRFAPLSRGRVCGDTVTCGYHGLTFAADGRCIRNPHGKGIVPKALSVRSYPVVERQGMIWIWMGEGAAANIEKVPTFSFLDDQCRAFVRGRLHVQANYELVVDNLLDLTHVEFLHPFLSSPGNSERMKFKAEQKGDTVIADYDVRDEPTSGLFQLLWGTDAPQSGDMYARMHWNAPANLLLETGMMPAGARPEDGPSLPMCHLLTPETEDSTHYFWVAGRDRGLDNATISQMLHAGISTAFGEQDEPMIRAVRSRMRSNDLFEHRPALLPMDEASVRARRVLRKRIGDERQSVTIAGG